MSNSETLWTFKTARFVVRFEVEQDYGYQYDGDDESGEIQAALDSGEMVAFDSRVTVALDGEIIGSDSLGGSVYEAGKVAEFYTSHRDRDPMNRNCTIYRDRMMATTGHRSTICHYFPDMVAQAISEARAFLNSAPRMRATA